MVESKFKITDIGLIPKDWDIAKIEDVANVFGGGTPSTSNNKFWNGYINWLTPTEVGKKKYIFESKRKITELGLINSSSRILPVGSILITTRAGIGDIGILQFESATNQGFQSLVPLSKVEGEYLYYVATTLKPILLQNSSGSTFLEISPSKVKAIRIPLPPLPEQKAIAKLLSDTDVWIDSLENIIFKKRQVKQGAMQMLLTPNEDWEVKKLGEVAQFRRGSFPQPYGLSKWYDDNNGVPFIQVYDVGKNRKLKNDTKRKISALAQPMSVFVPKGQIVITLQGSIGRIALTQYDAFCDRTILIFEKITSKINKYYFLLRVEQIFESEKEKAPGGTIKTITKEALSNFYISFPKSLKEQTRIANLLSDMDAEIENLEKKLAKAKQLKQGMMQQLLTGKIRLINALETS